ncbi:MAG: acyl-CoA dehydrogenase family protein [Rhodospirillales bacterium]|nr:acyl-CoA dehydrogenase family protein [Rhodospirillales bacterium]
MDFTLNDEQRLLQESAERYLAKEYPFAVRRRLLATDLGFNRETWKAFADLGWLGIGIPEEFGGIGGSGVETAVLMEAFGAVLVGEPYLATCVLGVGVVRLASSPVQKKVLLPKVATGDLLLAFAFAEPGSRYELSRVATRARKNGSGFVLDGRKAVVFDAAAADTFIVAARTAGGVADSDGITLFLVEADAKGLTRRDYPTVDGRRASEVTLKGVAVDADAIVGAVDSGLPVIEWVIDHAIAAVTAEAVGIMSALNRQTLEYLKTRRQFGRPLANFQVLQHRMVDMFAACELSKSMAYMAAVRAGDRDADSRAKAVSAAKVQIGKAGRFVGQQAVQLHGGMGMTDELPVGHYFKRLTMIDTLFGDVDFHLRRFAGG